MFRSQNPLDWAGSRPVTLSCIPFETDEVDVDAVCKKSTVKNLNFKICDVIHRVVRKVMPCFGFRRRHFISHCLYSRSLHLPAAILISTILLSPNIIYTDSTQFSGGPIQTFSGSNGTKEPFLHCLFTVKWHVRFHSSRSTKSVIPISPWCTTVVRKQSLTGCWVKAML